jgi:hypothetical protein
VGLAHQQLKHEQPNSKHHSLHSVVGTQLLKLNAIPTPALNPSQKDSGFLRVNAGQEVHILDTKHKWFTLR